MSIFLTGGTGFVGGALGRALTQRGENVTALARNISKQPAEAEWRPNWVVGDITKDGSWKEALSGHDTVVHAAGRLGAFGISEAAYNRLHVDGTRRLFEAAAACGVERILYISSPGVLGSTNGPPLTELAPYGPTNPYERSKAAAEKMVLEMAAAGLPVIVVRPEFLYGPGDLHVLGLFKAIESGRFFLINGGRSTCHPTFIDDGVRGMLLALDRGQPGEIYQIAGPAPVEFRHFVDGMAEALGSSRPKLSVPRSIALAGAAVLEQIGHWTGWRPPLTRSAVDFFSTSYRFSWAKAERELGYRPHTALPDGLRQTVAWYRQNGYLPRPK